MAPEVREVVDERRGKRVQLHLTMIVLQVAFSGFETLSRTALSRGTGEFSFTFYRNSIAVLVLGVLALMVERKKVSLDFLNALKIFSLGFMGVTVNQLLYLVGLRFTSAIFASTIRNTIPLFTFSMSVVFRKEKLLLRTKHGQAKLVGCILGVCGSLLLSLYKGPVVISSSLSVFHGPQLQRVQTHSTQSVQLFRLVRFNMDPSTLGALCLIASCISFSAFLILQTSTVRRLSAPVTFAALCCLSSLVQVPLVATLFQVDWSKWTRFSTREVIVIAYAGSVASGFISAAQSWGVQTGGPVIVAAYQPIETVVTAFLGLLLLRENLHLGSILGALVVILGLYILIWGQEKERRDGSVSGTLDSSRIFPMSEEDTENSWRVYIVNEKLHEVEITSIRSLPLIYSDDKFREGNSSGVSTLQQFRSA